MEKIMQLAKAESEYMTKVRRHLHQHPEASMQEVETQKYVVAELEAMGLTPIKAGGTGVYCDITGNRGDGKKVLLRADMDALSVQETNEFDFKSEVDGMMHACGHDGHVASLLGAAKVLLQCRDDFAGTVRLCFQPGEEVALGAKAMIADGVADGMDASIGIHLWSGVETGTVSCEAGNRMAAASWFIYKIIGKPGHGGLPHQGVDAGLAACAAIQNLQHLVSRENSPLDPLVITVGCGEFGSRWNVLAAEATFAGTGRWFSKQIEATIFDQMERVVKETAAAYRCEAEVVRHDLVVSSCINPEKASARCTNAVTKLLGEKGLAYFPLQMGGEDYCFFMDKIPDSIIVFVGTGNAEKKTDIPHHAGNFNLDEDSFPISAAVYAQYAVDFLNE